ncbi:MAG TPA: DoxX family protein [Gemmatimonadota bacterium]|nr:DoxX family protein [Gemmatimonadota bacterium]
MTDAPLFPALLDFVDLALYLLRVWIAILFGWSGWAHLRKPRERGESIGMPPAATAALGAVELAGAILLVVGLWVQPAAAALAAVMLGAIFQKAVVWKSGFWGDDSQGWYYEVLYLLCNLVILTTGGGSIGL